MAKAADGRKAEVCFLCGQERGGIPAKEDMLIRTARKIRSLLRLRCVHTASCAACLQECYKRRSAFEGRRRAYRIGAALFFLLTAAGAALFGRLDAPSLLGALLGAALIALLPYTSYCPAFPPAEEKSGR